MNSNIGKIIAIASGKGGVGKTWLAINIAHSLAKRDLKCLLFDGDLGLANVDIQLGIIQKYDVLSVLRGVVPMRAAIVTHTGGFDILSGRSGCCDGVFSGAALQSRIECILQLAARSYDVVIVDLGAGIDMFVRKISSVANMTIVVATDEPTSITDAYAVLKLHKQDRHSGTQAPSLMVNFAKSLHQGGITYQTLAKASQSFLRETPQLLGIIRRDERVRISIRRQTLMSALYPGSNIMADIHAVAEKIATNI